MLDLIIIGGENPVFIKEELEKTINSFPESDRTIYYGDELATELFFSDIMTGSLFCNRRMLIVRHVEKTKSDFEKKLLDYLKDPLGSVSLVLEYQKIPTKVLNTATELGNQRAKIYNFKKAWPQDQKKYIQRKLSDKGISMSSSVPDLLISYAGEDIQELSGMIDKLITFIGTNKTSIDDSDVIKVLERAQNASIFDLMDAIFHHNKIQAIQNLQDLLHAGESFPAIIAMFYRSTKIMWAVKTSKNGQMHEGFTVSPYEWKKYQGLTNINNLKFLSSCFECINILEIESKTKSDIHVQLTFEKFLCGL